jgi:predicted transcriptional regulator
LTLEEIAHVLDARALCGGDKLQEIVIPGAYASDLMSDVLALCTPGALLITGLTNIQIVRTAQMLDIPGVLFVRGKTPMQETIALAGESGISLLVTNMSLFQVCGILYADGIKPGLIADARG